MTKGDVVRGGAPRHFPSLLLRCAVSAAVLVTLLVAGAARAAGELDEALHLYQESQFTEAKAQATRHLDRPAGRLVYHLCQVHDTKNQQLTEGLAGLLTLYQDKPLRTDDRDVWAEAALSYARVIQLFQERKLHPRYAGVDVDKVFRSILAAAPDTPQACAAAIHLAESRLRSDDPKTQDEGFALLEGFLRNRTGDRKNTVALHLLLEGYYINLRGDYEKSYEHLSRAYELGIAKDMLRRVTLFRLGRMCDVKLDRKTRAEEHYREYLRLFPNALRAPVVRRYLEALQQKER